MDNYTELLKKIKEQLIELQRKTRITKTDIYQIYNKCYLFNSNINWNKLKKLKNKDMLEKLILIVELTKQYNIKLEEIIKEIK